MAEEFTSYFDDLNLFEESYRRNCIIRNISSKFDLK